MTYQLIVLTYHHAMLKVYFSIFATFESNYQENLLTFHFGFDGFVCIRNAMEISSEDRSLVHWIKWIMIHSYWVQSSFSSSSCDLICGQLTEMPSYRVLHQINWSSLACLFLLCAFLIGLVALNHRSLISDF